MQADRARAIQTAPVIQSPLWSWHIEESKVAFRIAILRAASRNVLVRPEHWEIRQILAATAFGAMQAARYHCCFSIDFEFLTQEGKRWQFTPDGRG
jgi:hypothetical protein